MTESTLSESTAKHPAPDLAGHTLAPSLLTLTNQARLQQRSKIYDITVHKKVRKRVCSRPNNYRTKITLQSLATGPVPLGEKEIQHNYSVRVQLPCILRNNDYIDLQKRRIYLAVRSYCFLQDSLKILSSKLNSEKQGAENCALAVMGTFSSQDGNAKEDVDLKINICFQLESRE